MTDDVDELGTIDTSIKVLENYIERNQQAARRLMTYLIAFSGGIGALVLALYLPFISRATGEYPPSEAVGYVLAALFVVVFGVLMAVYRFHLNEIARAEHYRIGFHRIRIAANNATMEGFQSEVRQALTERAFEFQPLGLLSAGKGKQIDSPLPGHPTSDLTALVLNKLLEGLEVRKKK